MTKNKQEIIKPPLLFNDTQRIIKYIEDERNIKLLCYWSSVNGSICQNDVSSLYEIIKEWSLQEEIYFFVKSDGGDGKASLRIINLLREHCKRLVVVIQGECTSAATMLALGADEIQMGPLAFLSAVDTTLTHDLAPIDRNNNLVSISQNELTRVLNLWREGDHNSNPYENLYQYIHPLIFGAVDRASSLSIKLCTDILSYHMTDKDKAKEISRKLNSEYPDHNYPILLNEAKEIGLNVTTIDKTLNDLLFDLNNLYSQMGSRALTDYDEDNYHDNEIRNILEARGIQFFFQVDKDWHYRTEERRYIPMNDNSSWYKTIDSSSKGGPKPFDIR